jgi:hypothetical protein
MGSFLINNPSYRTIKALVFDFVRRCHGDVNYEALTEEVRRYFPDSRWKRTHWAWYRYQILYGRFRGQFSDSERLALSQGTGRRMVVKPSPPHTNTAPVEPPALARGPQARDPEVKKFGDLMLNHIRQMLIAVCGDDLDKRFKLNRWVLSRLLQDEMRVKRPIKQRLWDQGRRACEACGEPFASLKGVELHRKDPLRQYSIDNCDLLCRECHQELGQRRGENT